LLNGDEVRVFDAIGSRSAGPADLERIIDLGSALRTAPHVLFSDLVDLKAGINDRWYPAGKPTVSADATFMLAIKQFKVKDR
jgi:hypothetical protein